MNDETRPTKQLPAVSYRTARAEDVPAMADVFLTAVTDMFARNNVSISVPPRPAVIQGYEHVRSTGIFRVAEAEDRIIAIAGAIVRDELWHLSAFWALPGVQRQGVGMPLLKQVRDAGAEAGATTFFTWSSIDTTAMASYMKLGMRPGYQILLFEGTPRRLSPVPAGYEAAPLDKAVAAELDRHIRGTRRDADHSLWSSGLQGRQVHVNGEIAGYYYLNHGAIGPAAWKKPEHAEAVMALACGEAAATAPTIRLAVPGINHAALDFALSSGLRLASFAHFLTTAPFGRLEQYVSSGPSLY